ncbi:MAG TPA: response regulator [Nitrospirota bacterium]|nr:response regulator [Nitrospirota bacterium]
MAEMISQGAGLRTEDRSKRFLLVVDGDGSHLYYTGILLQRLEYTIHTIKTAEEALEIMNVARPSLILTEVELPRMNGIDFLKQMKKNSITKSIPVIVYTLLKDPNVRESCLKEGATAFLQKPVDPDALYAAIQRATEATPRNYIRLTTCLNVIIGSGQGSETDSRNDCVTALSEHGMYVSTPKPRPAGLRVAITLLLGKAKLKIDGVVLYSFDKNKGPLQIQGMGIKFLRIKPEDQSLIKTFIEKQLTEDLRPTT